jgi:hypothetical protein
MKPPMSGVPHCNVGQVVQDFIDFDGITNLQVTKDGDGTFTITPVG